jgi:RimJ/RimL family protein N-acetyltransferase
MIRKATEADLPALITMGGQFIERTEYKEIIKTSRVQLAKYFSEILMNADATIFVFLKKGIVSGMIGLLAYIHPMTGSKVVAELFWWMDPNARGRGLRLLKEAKKWATDRDAEVLQMVAPNDRVGKLYERLKFTRIETNYQIELKG